MVLDYIDLLYGEPIPVDGVGYVRSPKVKELTTSGGVGWRKVMEFITFLKISKEDLVEIFKTDHPEIAELCESQENLTAFDLIISIDSTRRLLTGILNFFFEEDVCWEQNISGFVLTKKDNKGSVSGYVNRSNYKTVFAAICESCHLFGNFDELVLKHSSKQSEEAWNKVQEYLEKQGAVKKQNDNYNIGNIVAKLCGSNIGYNLFNVYDLTMFQLYDAFYQVDYLRMSSLDEAIFSHFGGETFKFENWLKPVIDLSNKQK